MMASELLKRMRENKVRVPSLVDDRYLPSPRMEQYGLSLHEIGRIIGNVPAELRDKYLHKLVMLGCCSKEIIAIGVGRPKILFRFVQNIEDKDDFRIAKELKIRKKRSGMWEYNSHYTDNAQEFMESMADLATFGEDRWELVCSVHEKILVFRRPILKE